VCSMHPRDTGAAARGLRYEARITPAIAPEGTVFAVRVLPRHADLTDPMSSGCVTWSD
jgi:hypothetical protein